MLLLLEGALLCFLLLLTCVVGIANGPAGLAVLYERDVQERAVALGYTSRAQIRRRFALVGAAMFAPVLVLTPLLVYAVNGASGFADGFWQMTVILWIMGLFDRLFIDLYWVGHTKAWIIPGTEDLRPYIPGRVCVQKWFFTLLGMPAIAAALAGLAALLQGG